MITFINPKPWNCDTCGKELDYWINLAKAVTCEDCHAEKFSAALQEAIRKTLDGWKARWETPQEQK